jgi:hypothetical protein
VQRASQRQAAAAAAICSNALEAPTPRAGLQWQQCGHGRTDQQSCCRQAAQLLVSRGSLVAQPVRAAPEPVVVGQELRVAVRGYCDVLRAGKAKVLCVQQAHPEPRQLQQVCAQLNVVHTTGRAEVQACRQHLSSRSGRSQLQQLQLCNQEAGVVFDASQQQWRRPRQMMRTGAHIGCNCLMELRAESSAKARRGLHCHCHGTLMQGHYRGKATSNCPAGTRQYGYEAAIC